MSSTRYPMVAPLIVALVLLAACGPAALTATPAPSTDTPVPPTAAPPIDTPAPTDIPTPPTPTLRPTATPLPPLSGSGGGVIAFVSTRSGDHQVYVMNADGTDQRRLTHRGDSDGIPDWSPDGTRIALHAHYGPDVWAIEVIDADGSSRQRLTQESARDAGPVWSPDGTQIAFSSDRDGNYEIYVMTVPDETGTDDAEHGPDNLRQLTDDDADTLGIDWSPDGTQLVFASDLDGDYEIYAMAVDGSNRRQLTDDDTDDWWPAWSPDGTRIAFMSQRYGDWDIFVMDADGNNPRRLTHDRAADAQPAWSPDGTQIVFNSDRDGDDDIYVLNVDDTEHGSSDVQQLTNNPAMDWGAVWRPEPATSAAGPGNAGNTWFKIYGGQQEDVANDVLLADDGGCFIVGATNLEFDTPMQGDLYLIRTDAAGHTLWEKTYEGEGYRFGQSISWANDGDLLVSGVTASPDGGDMDIFLTKLDQEGNELWSRTFGGPLDEFGAVWPMEDGSYLLGGNMVDPNDIVVDNPGAAGYGGFAGRSNVYVARTASDGNELWSHTFGGENNVVATAAAPSADGGFLILATIMYYPENDDDIYLLKVDENGNEVWFHTWDKDRCTGRDLIPTTDGNYLLTGIYSPLEGTNQSAQDFLFIKVDLDGNELWRSTFGDPNKVDYASVLTEAADGGYVAAGNRVTSLSSWDEDLVLVKIDENGQFLWERIIETNSHNMFGAILRHFDGGYVVTGSTFRNGGFDVFLLKTDAQGNVMGGEAQ